MDKKLGKILGVVLGIITIVLIAVTFFVNLGTVTEKVSILGHSSSSTTNSTFFGTIYNGHFSSWAKGTTGLTGSALNKANSGIDMIYASMATIIIAAVFAIIGIVAVFGKSSKIMKNMSFIAPTVSAILIIVTIVLYYEGASTVISALTSGIPPSLITTTVSLAIGAYLAIAAVVVEFLAAGFNIISHGKH